MEVVQRSPTARWLSAAGLALIIVLGGGIGFLVSRPPAPPRPAPTPTPEPAAPRLAFGFSVADDPAQRDVVLFGGVDSDDSTWLWNGRGWTLARPHSSPPGRVNAPAAYDPATRQVMVFGGRLAGGDLVNDTWAWNGIAWTELDDGGAGAPPAGEGGTMVWDGALGTMLLAVPIATPGGPSGETWRWSATRWTRLAAADFPAGVEPVAAAAEPGGTSVLAVGGQDAGRAGGLLSFVTLRWNGTSWRLLPTHGQLTSTAGIALDPISGRLMVAAENGFPAVPATSTAWSWTGSDWTLLRNTSGPPWPQATVTDPSRGRLLLFATLFPSSQNTPQTVHVWAWQGTRWHRLDG